MAPTGSPIRSASPLPPGIDGRDRVDTAPGAAIYGPILLRFAYDIVVLGIYFPYAWRCPTSSLREHYNHNITFATSAFASSRPTSTSARLSIAPSTLDKDKDSDVESLACPKPGKVTPRLLRILDIGVGSGYFLEHAALPKNADVVLADLNPACLEATSARLKRTHPSATVQAIVADFLEGEMNSPRALSLTRLDALRQSRGHQAPEDLRFDAISCMLLLHCVPGPPARKAEALVRLGRLLRPAGVLFGATILGKGHNWLGRCLMGIHNRRGIFDNSEDDVENLMAPLREAFQSVECEVIGRVLVFVAKGPRLMD